MSIAWYNKVYSDWCILKHSWQSWGRTRLLKWLQASGPVLKTFANAWILRVLREYNYFTCLENNAQTLNIVIPLVKCRNYNTSIKKLHVIVHKQLFPSHGDVTIAKWSVVESGRGGHLSHGFFCLIHISEGLSKFSPLSGQASYTEDLL